MADGPPVLVLEAVNDHENIGALFRNAAAFGVDAVVLDPTTADPLYRRSTRVSLGHVLRVPFARADALAGRPRTSSAPPASPRWRSPPPPTRSRSASSWRTPPSGWPCVLGAEGPGLTDAAWAAVDRRVRIPMAPGVDSVNVATAAAIALAALRPRLTGRVGTPLPPELAPHLGSLRRDLTPDSEGRLARGTLSVRVHSLTRTWYVS